MADLAHGKLMRPDVSRGSQTDSSQDHNYTRRTNYERIKKRKECGRKLARNRWLRSKYM